MTNWLSSCVYVYPQEAPMPMAPKAEAKVQYSVLPLSTDCLQD